MTDQRLTVFKQLFSWTSIGSSKCSIDKTVGLQGHLTVWAVPWLPCALAQNSFTEKFFQMKNLYIFSNKSFKKSHCAFSTISLHYQMVIDQKLTVFHQLFSWTSVGLSKCSIDKMIDSQDHLIVLIVAWLPCALDENSFTETFFANE